MKVIRKDEGEVQQGKTFTKTTFLQRMLEMQQPDGMSLTMVTFEDGSLTHWHEHPGEQLLYIVEGEGRVGTETEEFTVKAGDVVYSAPGEKHWHGAAPGQTMKHISITTVGAPRWEDHGPE
jgi:quercetin dioxygenase-like cupin family protein